jgi:hypothetical protein
MRLKAHPTGLYSKEPLVIGSGTKSSDEPNYDYETFSNRDNPKDIPPNGVRMLPAQASITFDIKGIVSGIKQVTATYPMLIKIYDGSTSPHISKFFVKVSKN